ncbi:hypothetical protein FGO68_gene3742 [Halteria grandinella]|uniref:Uncharacterized protein n=1 Tax=Halteria grandinella TaxID=5974 RepID=A0A8J8NGK9_HALGN|nr:hypothetical protein FGO68_gene3742 [Halteria grandinella]
MAALFDGSSFFLVQLSPSQSLLIFVSILIVNVGFFMIWIYYFVIELRTYLRNSYPQLYIVIFLCCKKEKYLIHKEIDEHNNRMKPMINSISELIEYLKMRKDFMEEGLLCQNDAEFKENITRFTQFKINDEQKLKIQLKANIKSKMEADTNSLMMYTLSRTKQTEKRGGHRG